jgi:hypothetical protein
VTDEQQPEQSEQRRTVRLDELTPDQRGLVLALIAMAKAAEAAREAADRE